MCKGTLRVYPSVWRLQARTVRWVRCQGGPEEDPRPDCRNHDYQAAWAEFGKHREEARVAFFPRNSQSLWPLVLYLVELLRGFQLGELIDAGGDHLSPLFRLPSPHLESCLRMSLF
jgi:hypothetical protein